MRLLALLLTLAAGPAAAGDLLAAEGKRVFQKCYACHSVDPRETGLPGPNLAGIVGQAAGRAPDFPYSPALRQAAAQGLVWDRVNLDRFLADPATVVPRTEMAFPGLRRAEERAAVIAYLAGAGR